MIFTIKTTIMIITIKIIIIIILIFTIKTLIIIIIMIITIKIIIMIMLMIMIIWWYHIMIYVACSHTSFDLWQACGLVYKRRPSEIDLQSWLSSKSSIVSPKHSLPVHFSYLLRTMAENKHVGMSCNLRKAQQIIHVCC